MWGALPRARARSPRVLPMLWRRALLVWLALAGGQERGASWVKAEANTGDWPGQWVEDAETRQAVQAALGDGRAARVRGALTSARVREVLAMFNAATWMDTVLPSSSAASQALSLWKRLGSTGGQACTAAKAATSDSVSLLTCEAPEAHFRDFFAYLQSPAFKRVLQSLMPRGFQIGDFVVAEPFLLRPGDFLGVHPVAAGQMHLFFQLGGGSAHEDGLAPFAGRLVWCCEGEEAPQDSYRPSENDLLLFGGRQGFYRYHEPEPSGPTRAVVMATFTWALADALAMRPTPAASAEPGKAAHGRTLFLTMCMGPRYFYYFCAPFLASYQRAYASSPPGAQVMHVWTLDVGAEHLLRARALFGPSSGVVFEEETIEAAMSSWHASRGTAGMLSESVSGAHGDCVWGHTGKANAAVPMDCRGDQHSEKVKFNNLRFFAWADKQLDATKEDGFEYVVIIDSDTLFVKSLERFLPSRSASRVRAPWDVAFTYYDREQTVPWGSNRDVSRTRMGGVRLNSGVQVMRHNIVARAWLQVLHTSSIQMLEAVTEEGGMSDYIRALLDEYKAPTQASIAALIGLDKLVWETCEVCKGDTIPVELEIPIGDGRIAVVNVNVVGIPARFLNQMESMPDGRFTDDTHIVHLKGDWWRTLVFNQIATVTAHRTYAWNRDAYFLWADMYAAWAPGGIETSPKSSLVKHLTTSAHDLRLVLLAPGMRCVALGHRQHRQHILGALRPRLTAQATPDPGPSQEEVRAADVRGRFEEDGYWVCITAIGCLFACGSKSLKMYAVEGLATCSACSARAFEGRAGEKQRRSNWLLRKDVFVHNWAGVAIAPDALHSVGCSTRPTCARCDAMLAKAAPQQVHLQAAIHLDPSRVPTQSFARCLRQPYATRLNRRKPARVRGEPLRLGKRPPDGRRQWTRMHWHGGQRLAHQNAGRQHILKVWVSIGVVVKQASTPP